MSSTAMPMFIEKMRSAVVLAARLQSGGQVAQVGVIALRNAAEVHAVLLRAEELRYVVGENLSHWLIAAASRPSRSPATPPGRPP